MPATWAPKKINKRQIMKAIYTHSLPTRKHMHARIYRVEVLEYEWFLFKNHMQFLPEAQTEIFSISFRFDFFPLATQCITNRVTVYLRNTRKGRESN